MNPENSLLIASVDVLNLVDPSNNSEAGRRVGQAVFDYSTQLLSRLANRHRGGNTPEYVHRKLSAELVRLQKRMGNNYRRSATNQLQFDKILGLWGSFHAFETSQRTSPTQLLHYTKQRLSLENVSLIEARILLEVLFPSFRDATMDLDLTASVNTVIDALSQRLS